MKKTFFLLFIFFAIKASAQDVSGLYTGILVNDSTKKVQVYELALSEYRDKITGYSYTTFVVNDTFYYSIKRVKGTKQNGELVVEDVKMIVNNFPESPAKRVRQIVTVPISGKDSIIDLNGRWKTTQTKEYYSLAGGLDMKKNGDSSRSSLINHLKELNILANQNTPQHIAEAKPKAKEVKEKKAEPVVVSNKQKEALPVAVTIPPAQRANKTIQTIQITSDSLVLSFYDNGVVDGDTISVFINGESIISQTRLTAAAVKKTIQSSAFNADDLTLTLVAENLGTIPPNTGLLIIQDGNIKHEIRFTADLQNNASVIIKRKKTADK